MKTRSATSNARRTLLRRGRDLLRSAGKGKKAKSLDVMELLTEGQRQELASIHLALERIERGIFGACEDCSDRISEERLQEMPWNLKCAHCELALASDMPVVESVSSSSLYESGLKELAGGVSRRTSRRRLCPRACGCCGPRTSCEAECSWA